MSFRNPSTDNLLLVPRVKQNAPAIENSIATGGAYTLLVATQRRT